MSNETDEGGFKAMSQHADAQRDDAAEQAGRAVDKAQERAAAWHNLIADEIRDRPVRALGFAALAGLVLGAWVSR